MAERLVACPALTIVSGPATNSLPFVAVDLFIKSDWRPVASFAFIAAVGAALLFGTPLYSPTRENRTLSSTAADFLVGARSGAAAMRDAAFTTDPAMLSDVLKAGPDGGCGPAPLILSGFDGAQAIVSRLVGARRKAA